jgi:hypothetical protein
VFKGKYDAVFKEYHNNKQKCSLCNRRIPKYIKRVSISYKSEWGWQEKRVCEHCINEFAKHINQKSLVKWNRELVAKVL